MTDYRHFYNKREFITIQRNIINIKSENKKPKTINIKLIKNKFKLLIKQFVIKQFIGKINK